VITAQSPEAAADQMIGNSVALQECEQRYKNFRSWLVLAAMHRSNLGATLRLFFGAGLSMFDFVTDGLMIRDYFQQTARYSGRGHCWGCCSQTWLLTWRLAGCRIGREDGRRWGRTGCWCYPT